MRIVAVLAIPFVAGFTAVAQDLPSRIERAHVIIVEGKVTQPGPYPTLEPGSTNTVLTAIAQAGGLLQSADRKAFIIRADDQGVTHTLAVSLSDIMAGKKPDVPLQAGDILQVPESPKTRIRMKDNLPQIDPPSVSPPINGHLV
jgi:protein involved in polysaccharide export with SLBB domain